MKMIELARGAVTAERGRFDSAIQSGRREQFSEFSLVVLAQFLFDAVRTQTDDVAAPVGEMPR